MMCSSAKVELTDEEVGFFFFMFSKKRDAGRFISQIQDLVGKVSDFMSQPKRREIMIR